MEVELVRHRRGTTLAGLLFAVALLAAACAKTEVKTPSEKPKAGGTFRVQISEPGSLDPPVASGSEDIIVVKQIFDGLVTYNDKTAAVEPQVATKWEPNTDATKWTFHLRQGTKFTNGEEVTADSFVRGMTRSLLPDFYNSPDGIGYHLDGIKGAADVSGGTTTTLAGVTAPDKYTLVVETAAPDAEFPVRAGHMPFLPIPSDTAIAAQKPSWAENPIGNGPFKLKEPWQHNQSITLVRNDGYYGTKALLDEVNFKILADQDTAYLEWQAGNLEWTRIPPAKLDEAKKQNPGNFLIRDMAGITYLTPTLLKAPMDNKLFRQAVSLSIDRKKISDAVFFGLNTSAAGVLPALIPGSRAKGATGPCKYCTYDPAKAKQLFQQSGVKIDKLTMFFNAGAGHDAWMQASAQQIQETLGFPVEAVAATAQFTGGGGYTGWVKKSAPASIDRLGWGLDYPTADNFLFPLLFSTSSDNKANYNNPAFDKLINDARAETDAAKRIKLFQQAEDLALEDMAIIPMWWRTQFRLVKLDKFGGIAIDPFEDPTLRTAFLKSSSSPAS